MYIGKDQLLALKKNMIDLAHMYVQDYISDLVIDFDFMDRLSANGEFPEQLILLLRDCGTDLYCRGDDFLPWRAKHASRDCKFFEIDVAKLISMPDEPVNHYTDLRNTLDEACVITRIERPEIYFKEEKE